MENQKYGDLLHQDIKIFRQYFRECVKLLGIRVLYRAPMPDKQYTTYAEIDSNYMPPIMVGCIFDEYPTQKTAKKMGWVAELSENSSFIHVDYDLPGLQVGALFIIPSGLDDGKARIFRVVNMATSIIYPASIICEIIPEYIDNFEKISDGPTVDEVIESEKLDLFEDEYVGPMTEYAESDICCPNCRTEEEEELGLRVSLTLRGDD